MTTHAVGRGLLRVLSALVLLSVAACSSNPGRSSSGVGTDDKIGTLSSALVTDPGSCTSATFNSEIYYFCSNASSWVDARTQCSNTPGLALARIDSAAENAFVASKMAGTSWLAANDRSVEGAWRWSVGASDDGPQFWSGGFNGSAVGGLYANWEPGQPNDLGTQDCAAMESDAKWDDKSCTETRAFVCEGDACPNDANKLEPGICGCGVSDADTDGDGRVDCLDLCPLDPFKVEPGDCGCANAPTAAGAACDDGLCAANAQCDGAGTCGNPADCAPASGCTYQRYAAESGRGYFFCTGPLNWSAAKTQCEARPGMGLVRIDDGAENAFVLSKLTGAAWLAADDRTLEGTWRWAQPGSDKGDQFWSGAASGHTTGGRFASWKAGQPDDSGGADCARMDPANAGGWDDTSCTGTAGYVCEIAADQCKGNQAGSPWPSTRRCAAHDARSAVVGAQTNDLNWAVALAGTTPVGSPSVASDGTIYVAVDSKIFAVSESGSVKWSFTAGGTIDSTPAVASDGTIYFGASDEHAYRLSPSGVKLAEHDLLHPIHSSPVIGPDGTVYVSNGDDLHALQPDESELWHDEVGDSDGLSPAVGPHRTIYIGSRLLNKLTAVAPGGDQLWTFNPGANVGTTASVAADGTIYFGAGSSLFAVTPAGTQKWKVTAGATVKAIPAIGADGTIYTASNDGVVRAVVGATGAARWTRSISGAGASSPAVDSSGDVYIGASDGTVYALKPSDGSTLWSRPTGGAVATAPAIGSAGTVYVGSADGKLYSIGGGPTPFVNCVSQAGDRFVALFGYDNKQSISATVPLGPQNKLTPTPTLASVQPPTTFAPGRHDVGFWVPMNAASVTWELRGLNATASTTSSPRCTAAAYPNASPNLRIDHERYGQVSSLRPKIAPDFQSTAAASSSSSSSGGIGTIQQPLSSFQAGFKIDLSELFVGDPSLGFCDIPEYDFELKINGQSCGTQQVAGYNVCDKGGFPHCSACGVAISVGTSYVCSQPVNVFDPTVTAEYRLIEVDDNGDDHLAGGTLTIDNVTGQIVASTNGQVDSSGIYFDNDSSWGFRFGISQVGPPNLTSPPQICATWNADYVDENFGEDFTGTQALPAKRRIFPASFAQFALDVQSPFGTFHAGGPTSFLDADGCIPSGQLPPNALLHLAAAAPDDVAAGGLSMKMTVTAHLRRPDGVEVNFVPVSANAGKNDVIVSTTPDPTDGHVDFGPEWFIPSGVWSVPMPKVQTSSNRELTPTTVSASTLDRILLADDMGIVPGTYTVRVGDGLSFNAAHPDELDALFSGQKDALLTGTEHTVTPAVSCTTDADCLGIQFCRAGLCRWPSDERWKFINAHEAGHMFQDRAMGGLGTTYLWDATGNTCPGKFGLDNLEGEQDSTKLLDPPCGELFCGCQHVDNANGYHCLQSVEDTSSAQVEGFAQFYASKSWNRQNENDCTFVYYKEFLNPAGCPAGADCVPFPSNPADSAYTWQHGVMQSILPPFPHDCRDSTEFRWRNTVCKGYADFGTELDWLRFYWNLNTVSPNRSTMPDLFQIYRHACHPDDNNTTDIPPNCGDDPNCRAAKNCSISIVQRVGWEPNARDGFGFRHGAEKNYGLNTPKYNYVVDVGDRFGVSLDLTPNP